MSAPTLTERVQAIEDELAGLESALDSRTRMLWSELQKLQVQVKELAEAKTPLLAQQAQGGNDE